MYFVYILRCGDDSLYTGFTDDIKKRIHAHYHKTKAAAKYTKSHGVKALEALWICDCESAARKLEIRIKRLKRKEKLSLIKTPEKAAELFPDLSEYEIAPETETKFEDCI